MEGDSTINHEDIYSDGPFEVKLLDVPAASNIKDPQCKKVSSGPSPAGLGPPRDLFIAVPQKSGQYPVIQIQHAFTMRTSYYSQLLQHVASHGFIVIAPQMDQISLPDATGEIAKAVAVVDWYPNNLATIIGKFLPSLNIVPNLNNLVLLGHSRGGKVAFGMATGTCKSSLNYSAIASFDPVDGTGIGHQTPPPILPNKPDGLNLSFPTLVVGAGLGPQSKFGLSCAPLGVSHDAFFEDSAALAFHFVASKFGHMDYLDDTTPGLAGAISYEICKNGPSREPMRRFAGGIFIAFLEAVLFQDYTAISNAFSNPSLAPVQLDPAPQMKGVLPTSSFGSLLRHVVNYDL